MSNVRSIDRIISAKDYGGSMKGYLKKCQRDFLKSRGIAVQIKDIDKPFGTAVKARIWQSQWVADCECNTTMFVDPDEPIFFCFGCGNRSNGSRPRPVEFPPEAERKEIERLLLERPVIDEAGLTDLERVGLQKPLIMVDVEEIDEQALMATAFAMKDGKKADKDKMPEIPKRTVTRPLTRSWSPGESIADLENQQRDALEKWRREFTRGVQ